MKIERDLEIDLPNCPICHSNYKVESCNGSMGHFYCCGNWYDQENSSKLKEKFEDLKNLVKTYLNHPSVDGHIQRLDLRKKLLELAN